MQGNDYYTKDNETYLGSKDEIEEEGAVLQFYFNCFDSGGEDRTVLEYLFKHMTLIKESNWPKEHTGEYYTLMHILERYDLIESGVSIRVPWLTELGELAYNDIKTVLNK